MVEESWGRRRKRKPEFALKVINPRTLAESRPAAELPLFSLDIIEDRIRKLRERREPQGIHAAEVKTLAVLASKIVRPVGGEIDNKDIIMAVGRIRKNPEYIKNLVKMADVAKSRANLAAVVNAYEKKGYDQAHRIAKELNINLAELLKYYNAQKQLQLEQK